MGLEGLYGGYGELNILVVNINLSTFITILCENGPSIINIKYNIIYYYVLYFCKTIFFNDYYPWL